MGLIYDILLRGGDLEIFSVNNISYAYADGKKALDSVTLHIHEGESLTVIGANGSGKSTLLYILDGILEPETGGVVAFGQPVEKDFDGLRQKVSLLFQNPQVQLFSLSVLDEICFGPLQLGLSRAEVERRAIDILRLLGIEHLKDRGPWNLSGGEMKKVALGTCLSVNPDVLLLDEPTTGLDPRSQVELIDLIVALRKAGKTIITATHDLGIIEDISDRTVVFDESHRIILDGKPWDVLKNEEVLLRANLMHFHAHRHSWYVHEHTHSGMHDHEHIRDLPELISSPALRKAPTLTEEIEATTGGKREMEKLKILIDHWTEHNHEHAETYMQWAEKAEAAGRTDLAGVLREIASETKKINSLFEKAKRIA